MNTPIPNPQTPGRAFERTPAESPNAPSACAPSAYGSSASAPLPLPESLDLLYAVIEGAGSYLSAYTDADGGRLASALRSALRIIEQASREC
jgi:hypothetical protein